MGVEVKDHVPDNVSQMLAAFHDVFRQLANADCHFARERLGLFEVPGRRLRFGYKRG